MRSTLAAIRSHPRLKLQIIATGMHLSARHGQSIQGIRDAGFTVDATVPWGMEARAKSASRSLKGLTEADSNSQNAIQTGHALAGIAAALARLQSELVVVVGDRVEAFAAAAAAHVGGQVVAHIHGGDRALGQVDDSLRHAITKLSHLHFPATLESEKRIQRLGEDAWRIHRVGSPGIDHIVKQASLTAIDGRYALLVLHPTDADEDREFQRATLVLKSVRRIPLDQILIIYPNNDPGSTGIIRCWEKSVKNEIVYRNLPRPTFLGLMRDAAVLIGNSSSGIIEAASFGTPVVDIGPRQLGRERSGNVVNVPFAAAEIDRELQRIWNGGRPIRYPAGNVYGGDNAGLRIANVLAKVKLDAKLRRKLIAY